MHVYEVRPCSDHRGVDLISPRKDKRSGRILRLSATHSRPGVIDFRHGGHGVPRHYRLDQLVFHCRRN